jgi:diguanylate cyclase (GGDEF)-like protein
MTDFDHAVGSYITESMFDGDQAFELKLLFLRELATGHVDAKAAHDALSRNPADRVALQSLREFFHKIAGTAENVDLALLGRLAAACETTADGLLESGAQPDWRALQILADGLAGVASVLDGSSRPQPSRPREPVQPEAPPSAPRVLVVDDDPFSARLIDSVLRAAGFDASYCCESDKAFAAIVAQNPDLLILDVAMPSIDGFRLCQRVRAHPGLQAIPIIFVTRKGDVAQRIRGLQVGGNDYVAKPFEPQELVARVQSHLRALSELRELAIRDGLTHCYNHKYFKGRLESEVARAQRLRTGLILGLLDVDRFKRINDAYGFPAGDSVLSHLASIVTASVRSADVVARYAGDKFAFLLLDSTEEEAGILVQRLRDRVERHRFEVPAVNGEPLAVSCTVRVATAVLRGEDTAQSLLQRADQLLFEARG